MKPRVSLRKALSDKKLLGNTLGGPSWAAWRTLLIASMGEALHEDERKLFKALTQRDHEPNKRVEEFVAVIGRRGGKSRSIATLVCYLAALCQHPSLCAGETGIVLIFAPDRRQSAVVLDYCYATLTNSPMLSQLVIGRTQDTISLSNHINIVVRSSDWRRLRGLTLVAAVADEIAFMRSDEESSNPDKEILDAVRPGLSTTGGPIFLISSPHARRGELFRIYQQHFGPQGDASILVAKGTSRELNPSLPQSVVDRALERDPASASAEYLAEFRTDIESFISRDVVDAATPPGRFELPPSDFAYVAFCDPSGGSSDAMTLAIAHIENGRVILDLVRERRPPFSPEAVVAEFAQTLKSYHVSTVRGDHYSGNWCRERFQLHGIEYKVSNKTKSEIYIELLPLLNSGQVELLDQKRLISQLCSLERRVSRGGRDSIDHPSGQHDDLINAAGGALVYAAQRTVKEVPIVAPIVVSLGSRNFPGGVTPATPPGGYSTTPTLLRQPSKNIEVELNMKKSDVEKAQEVLADLNAQREALIARGQELEQRRQEIAFKAHTGSKAERAQLDQINSEAITHDYELKSLDAAIAEATKRLAAADQAEALAQDRENARSLARGRGQVCRPCRRLGRCADSHGQRGDCAARNAGRDTQPRVRISKL